MTNKSDSPMATLADLDHVKAVVLGEVADIRRAVPQLSDGDPTNNGAAIVEIGQSIGALAAQLGVVVASGVYVLQSFGVL